MTLLWNNEAGFPVRPLHQITLPGTHDSGCYVDRLRDIGAKTQVLNIRGQLDGGIRYFDIRPCKYRTNEYWTWHGPMGYYGDELTGANGILAQITAFMDALHANDRELVVVNISHFDTAIRAGAFDHAAFIQLIVNVLGAHLIPHDQTQVNLFDEQLHNLLTNGAGQTRSRVAIIYDGAFDQGREDYVTNNQLPAGFFKLAPKYPYNVAGHYPQANEIKFFDQYAGSRQLDVMSADQMTKILQRQNSQITTKDWAVVGNNQWHPNGPNGTNGTLHLFSWTLTVPPWCPRTEALNTTNPALKPFFTERWGYVPGAHSKINILYVDHFASHTATAGPLNNEPVPVAIAHRMNILNNRPLDNI